MSEIMHIPANDYGEMLRERKRLRAKIEIDQITMDNFLGQVETLLTEGRNREKAAFLAGWDHYNASRSRMDMPRDRIGAYDYWRASAEVGQKT